VTQAQRARIGVHLNRRQPSEQDYAHFALYQANQRAYEATFLKHFVNHALHPSQIEQCLQDGIDLHANVQKYIAAVSANVNSIANKMIWNAHCRTVNLLANAGNDGAPFWDVAAFDRALFADFSPSNATLVSHKMRESWHLSALKPPMVRYTTRDYPIGHHSSPFEEIDEVADTLFSREAFGDSMPTGRAVKQPTKRKAKGQGLPGASIRAPVEFTHRDNWLASLVPSAAVQEYREPSPVVADPVDNLDDIIAPAEPRVLNDLRRLQDHYTAENSTTVKALPAGKLQSDINILSGGLTQLERLVEQFGADALSEYRPSNNIAPSPEQVEQVPTWPTRLLKDHRRRLTQRSPQVFRRALPSIRAVIVEAISQGYHPVDPEYEELIVDIESREHAGPASAEILETEIEIAHEQCIEPVSQESSHGKKRKRAQPPPIRMFNQPIERSKKKRKTDAAVLNIPGPSTLAEAVDQSRKQKITTSVSVGSALKTKPARKKTSQSAAAEAPSSHTPLPPHPSGSTTLEPHQHLPPDAYFTPQSPEGKPAWRCGIKHALGHYYNAGDRKNCPGCFTALSDNTKAVTMDFYLLSRTHYHQPNPTSSWRPSKPFGTTYGRARRSKHLSHNSIAKEAYWTAIDTGSSPDEARTTAVAAVLEHIKPKPPPREPTPAPTPTPEPDPGPHPSGSTTMEHTQDIPSCAYFEKQERHEEFAWRCDVNHALGRYYLAGDKRSCPGCGSNKGGQGRHLVMDFYLPAGVVVRQEVGEVKWRARKPYKMRKAKAEEEGGNGVGVRKKAKAKATESTHNQLASRAYWSAISAGQSPENALAWALHETDRSLDAREDARESKREAAKREARRREAGNRSTTTASLALNAARQRAARLRNAQCVSDGEDSTDDEMHDAGPVDSSSPSSDDDETSSGSDTE
jgi:hypothetical protein